MLCTVERRALTKTLMLGILILATFTLPDSEAVKLKCYRCLKLECPEDEVFCKGVREFVINQLPDLYYIDNNLPDCPDPDDLGGWMNLQGTYPSSYACGAVQENQATCTLGRFEVVTTMSTSETNVTSYGNILGCARHKLLQSTVIHIRHRDPSKPMEDRIVEINKCAIMAFNSTTHDSTALRHHLQLEHCSKITDMCFQSDYCINPKITEVKKFQDQTYGVNIPMTIFIVFAVVLGLIVCVLTFLGIKYA